MPPRPRMTPEDARIDHQQMLRFMALNAAFGIFLGLATAALLIGLNIGDIGTRIFHAQNPVLPIVLIAFPLALTFGAAVSASAIWLMPYERKFAAEPKDAEHRSDDRNDAPR